MIFVQNSQSLKSDDISDWPLPNKYQIPSFYFNSTTLKTLLVVDMASFALDDLFNSCRHAADTKVGSIV